MTIQEISFQSEKISTIFDFQSSVIAKNMGGVYGLLNQYPLESLDRFALNAAATKNLLYGVYRGPRLIGFIAGYTPDLRYADTSEIKLFKEITPSDQFRIQFVKRYMYAIDAGCDPMSIFLQTVILPEDDEKNIFALLINEIARKAFERKYPQILYFVEEKSDLAFFLRTCKFETKKVFAHRKKETAVLSYVP